MTINNAMKATLATWRSWVENAVNSLRIECYIPYLQIHSSEEWNLTELHSYNTASAQTKRETKEQSVQSNHKRCKKHVHYCTTVAHYFDGAIPEPCPCRLLERQPFSPRLQLLVLAKGARCLE